VSEVSFFAACLLHKGLLVNPVKLQMSSQSGMSSKEVGNNSGLCSVKGHKSGFTIGLGPEMSCCMGLFVGIISYKNFGTSVALLGVRTNEIKLHMCCETV